MLAIITNPGQSRQGGRRFTLRNRRDMQVTVSEHGAALVSWWAPDRYGRIDDILLGYPDQRGYARNNACIGAVVARACAAQAGAPLLYAPLWHGEPEASGAGVRLRALDAGAGMRAADVEVHYQLNDDGCLSIAYRIEARMRTVADQSSHPCFNLNGGRADVGDHMLQIDADRYLAIGPGGTLRDTAVNGTPFDFRRPAAIGPRLRWPHAQLGLAGGFDHCYHHASDAGTGRFRQVAAIHDPGTGRRLEVSTTESGLHFYSGNRLGGVMERASWPYLAHMGFCLDARVFRCGPGPGQDLILEPGEVYRHTTVYRLSLQS